MALLKEFKPALLFLGKFLAVYFAGNIFYGLYVESYEMQPDALTSSVAEQSSWVINAFGYHSSVENVLGARKVALKLGANHILHVFEGCNGINVMVVFVAFLCAFGGRLRILAIFLPIGLLIIHVFNLLRIVLLYDLALNDSSHFYYYHKYFFTAILYLIVLILWAIWVIRFDERRNFHKATA